MAMLIMMRYGNYTNSNAVENLIRYITRTRKQEERANELIAWGGWGIGCYATPELVIGQFRSVQKLYGIEARGGRRLFHEVLKLTDQEFEQLGLDYDKLFQIAVRCAEYYYRMGHQVVFAIHYSKVNNMGVHIHFVVNAVNFMTGKKWHTNMRENYHRDQWFNEKMREFMNIPMCECELPEP